MAPGTLRLQATLDGHSDRVWHVAFHPTLQLLASCGGDTTLRMWAPDNLDDLSSKWRCVAVLDMGSRTVRRCEWSPCGRFIAACSFDSKTTVWRKYTNTTGTTAFEAVATLEGHDNEVKAVAWNAAGTLLATCSRDKNVWLWEAAVDSKPAAAGDLGDDDFECLSLLCGHTQDVKYVAWNPEVDEVFSCSYDDTIKVWREEAGDDWFCVDTLAGHTSTVWSLAFEKGGNRFVSCSDDQTLVVWDASAAAGSKSKRKWTKACTLSGHHTDTIFTVDWSWHTGMIASGAADDSIRLFAEVPERVTPAAGTDPPAPFQHVLTVPKAHAGDVNHLRWHPRRKNLLASAGDDGLIKLWVYEPTDSGGPPAAAAAAAAAAAGSGSGPGSGAGSGSGLGAAAARADTAV